MSERPAIAVLKGPGINCELETQSAIVLAGGDAEVVHVGQFIDGGRQLNRYQGWVIPGGFSEGDAIRAGVVLARQLTEGYGEEVREFAESGRPILGICNGFQVLVETGLLPDVESDGRKTATLTENLTANFESRWVDLAVDQNAIGYTALGLGSLPARLRLPIANGEGRLVAAPDTMARLRLNTQILLRYCTPEGDPSMDPAYNPSGAMDSIAALCNPEGNVVGMMPHPERAVLAEHLVAHRRPDFNADNVPDGLRIMRSFVLYASSM